MKTTVILVHGASTNLYEWGQGWLSHEKHLIWDRFWRNLSRNPKAVFWHYCPPENEVSCGYLVSNYGCVYLHPEDFNAVLEEYSGRFKRPLQELAALLKEAAEACGGTYSVTASEPLKVNLPATKTVEPERWSKT